TVLVFAAMAFPASAQLPYDGPPGPFYPYPPPDYQPYPGGGYPSDSQSGYPSYEEGYPSHDVAYPSDAGPARAPDRSVRPMLRVQILLDGTGHPRARSTVISGRI